MAAAAAIVVVVVVAVVTVVVCMLCVCTYVEVSGVGGGQEGDLRRCGGGVEGDGRGDLVGRRQPACEHHRRPEAVLWGSEAVLLGRQPADACRSFCYENECREDG